ncbi:MAG: hypothetical protein ACFE0J_10135 [Elainellaceae cyanobacterium]
MIRFRPVATVLASASLAVSLASCNTVLTNDYEATAVTTYTWQVEYTIDPNKTHGRRLEQFASTTLVNQNGVIPDGAVTGPDDRGLWWPALPPRPTVDEMEASQRSREIIGTPELIKRVDYSLTYQADGETVTRPTDYSVYRQAVKAYENERPLELTLGIGDTTVEKAEAR